jgi:hypothetical protein
MFCPAAAPEVRLFDAPDHRFLARSTSRFRPVIRVKKPELRVRIPVVKNIPLFGQLTIRYPKDFDFRQVFAVESIAPLLCGITLTFSI